jgi:hypothetical protein
LDFTVADELEARLVPVNPLPMRCMPAPRPDAERGAKGGQTEEEDKRNAVEKERRDDGRHQVERINRLFRATKTAWSKKDVVGLSELIFRIDGLD